jgi:hypothetical protein
MIAIHTVNGTKYFGVYDNGGNWSQATLENLATAFAVLDEIPTIAGSYDGIVYEDTDTYYEADYTFSVAFSPLDESRVTADFLPVEFQATGVGVLAPTDYSTLTNNRILGQYK